MTKIKLKLDTPDLPRSETYLKETDINQLADSFYRTEFLTQFGQKQGRKIARAMAASLVTSQYLDLLMFETQENDYELFYDLEISETIH